ncbi:MAG TPA: acyl-CoA dehydrogenase family protein [Mycobacteriales bacterium]|nr:acyl-CoA dehydrogenase family protein [Mycobacteriales bacterium]
MPVISIPEEFTALTASLRDFIAREVMPLEDTYAQELQNTGHIADEVELRRQLRKKSVANGFYTLFMPEEVGGGGVGYLGMALAYEAVAQSGSYLASGGGVLPNVEGPTPVLLDCNDEQRERYLLPTMRAERETAFALTEPEAGSDATKIRTRAERKGDRFVINGRKHFITHGAYADYVLLFAVTDPDKGAQGGITCFLVDTDTPGFEVSRKQLTMYDDHQAELVFDNMEVGEAQILGREGYGFYSAMRWINGGRIQIAAGGVGIAAHLLTKMLDYAKTREAFGRPIGANQYIQGHIVDSLCELEGARYITYAAADAIDNGGDGRLEAAKAKYVASEMVGRVADRAIQVYGGNGYMTEMGIERYARAVRAMRLYEGTSEILKTNIAKGLGL